MSGTCAEARSLFSPAYDGELTGAEGACLRSHLAACDACRREFDDYAAELDGFGRRLHSELAGQYPQEPFPQPARRRHSGLGRFLGVAQAVLGVALLLLLVTGRGGGGSGLAPGSAGSMSGGEDRGQVQPSRVVVASLARGPDARFDCPWYEAEPQAILRSISYPVLADDCLDESYELVEARFRSEEVDGCQGDVHLTYAGGGRHLVLEQRRETIPECCQGEAVPLGRSVGCVEPRDDGGTSVRWNQQSQSFHLHGDVPLDDGLALAWSLSERF